MTVVYVKHDDVLRVFTELMIARKCTLAREALAHEILNDAEQICGMVKASFGDHDIKPVIVPGGTDVWPVSKEGVLVSSKLTPKIVEALKLNARRIHDYSYCWEKILDAAKIKRCGDSSKGCPDHG